MDKSRKTWESVFPDSASWFVRTVDIAVWRPGDGIWYMIASSAPDTCIRVQWGASGDIPLPADYDGEGNKNLGRAIENQRLS